MKRYVLDPLRSNSANVRLIKDGNYDLDSDLTLEQTITCYGICSTIAILLSSKIARTALSILCLVIVKDCNHNI